jgi:hypothetical protein
MEVTLMTFLLRFTSLLLLAALFLVSTPITLVSSAPPMPPPAPTLISPVNGAVMDNGCTPKPNGIIWDFDWSDVPGATIYHIRVWKNPALPIINSMGVTSSSYHYASAPNDHIINTNLDGWRWMVRAKVRGAWGRWSAVRFFRVEKLNTDCP